jgi:hypothetical protein
LLSWKGVTLHEHNFVTIFFYVEGSEMGHHLHGDSIADLKFPAKVSKKLVKEDMYLHIMSFQNLPG